MEEQRVAVQFLQGIRDSAGIKLAQELSPGEQMSAQAYFKVLQDPQYQEMMSRQITFVPSDNVKTMEERAVEFLVWQHEADRLGIHLSDKDINHELKVITGNNVTPTIWPNW